MRNSGSRDVYLHMRSGAGSCPVPERALYVSYCAEPLPGEASSLVSQGSTQTDEDGDQYLAYESTLPGVVADFK